MSNSVSFTCMTTKQKFEVEDPEVIVMSNGRYAYRAECPWKGKDDKVLTAYKFAPKAAYEKYVGAKPGAESDEGSDE